MGMRLILQGRTQLLMAKGANKADAIYKQALRPGNQNRVASSALQLHPNVIVLLDEAAAAKLS